MNYAGVDICLLQLQSQSHSKLVAGKDEKYKYKWVAIDTKSIHSFLMQKSQSTSASISISSDLNHTSA